MPRRENSKVNSKKALLIMTKHTIIKDLQTNQDFPWA